MGQELMCNAQFDGKASHGKAMLETDYVLFRGEFRVKIPFASMRSVKVQGHWLAIDSTEASLKLELGARAEKWAQKILHPPSRLDKLGVKPGMRVSILGIADRSFKKELEERGAEVRERVAAASDIIFFGVEEKSALDRVAILSKSIQPDGAIWIVYPKGVKQITQADVFAAMHTSDLVDTKGASFSSTHTALKAVIPVKNRDQRAAR